jgi:hypothetical protein
MISISERLKRAPRGLKLYSTIYGEVEFQKINEHNNIVVLVKDDYEKESTEIFSQYGRYSDCFSIKGGECVLFPSNENRDWSKFYYLDKFSRVMVSRDGSNWCLNRYISAGVACGINNENTKEWKYMVPVEEFDFVAVSIESNCNKSIV